MVKYADVKHLEYHLTAILLQINPGIDAVDYLRGYSSLGKDLLLKQVRIRFRSGQSRTIDLVDANGIREAIITMIASCYQKSSGGRNIRVRDSHGVKGRKKW